jgi:glycosyltransferase involved in cell wall biosynthesis
VEKRRGVRIVREGSRLGVYRAARAYWRSLPQGSFDVVVDEINTRPFLAPQWVNGTPVVALIHQLAREVWFSEAPLPVALLGRYLLEPRWLAHYRGIPALTVSESSAESLRRHHGWRDVAVIPEGLAAAAVARVPREATPTVVFLGRLVGMKRPEHAIRAFSLLRSAHPDARLWVVGGGPLEPKLRKEAPPGVEILGRVGADERMERLARAHVLVTTSVREGWGLNVSEAAVVGTPTIGYAVPGLVDSITASGGLLVPPDPDKLGRALVAFFDGRLALTPTRSTVSWDEVAEVVERHLVHAVDRASTHPVKETRG